jgi:hypothetical protein
MSYTTDQITDIRTIGFDGGLVLRARSGHGDRVVQCYLAGQLADWQDAPGESVEFVLAGAGETDLIQLLAVDPELARTDLWEEAFAPTATGANRVLLRTPQTIAPYLPGDRWRVCLGSAGQPQADTVVWEQDFYPAGQRACGWGACFGEGGLGWDGRDAPGFGRHFGHGEFGFDCEMLSWRSDPLPPGTYPYKVAVADDAGNESSAATGTVTLDTYARPASHLAVQSYNEPTDTLNLWFTSSEDLC